jgi:predicted permease
MRMGQRLYRLLVRVLPTDFRGDFADAMLADVAHAPQSAAFWWREIGGLLRAVVREHADAVRQDVKYSLRTMRRTPGFTLSAVLMLAVGTGVNVAMFSVIDTVVIQSPFAAPDRLVIIEAASELTGGKISAAVPTVRYQELAAASGPFESVAAFDLTSPVLRGVDEPRRLSMECVTASMFDVLKTPPMIGRTFTDDESKPGAAPVVVLSFPAWQQLGAPPAIVGTSLHLNDASATIVGVMPRGYAGVHSSNHVDGWAPLNSVMSGSSPLGCETSETVNAFGRLLPGIGLHDAEARLHEVRLVSLRAQTVKEYQTPFTVLSVAVVCVLLIACANVGSLQLERTLARRREFAVRIAIGAGRGRLVRQSLTESLVLAVVGGIAGLAAAALTLPLLVAILPAQMSHIAEIAVNGRALAAALGCAVTAGLLSGLFPLAQAARFTPGRDLAGLTRATARGTEWTRRVLVAIELTLSITLVVGAVLMIRTFNTLSPSAPGFEYANKLTTRVRLPASLEIQPPTAFADLVDRVRTIPGVRTVTGSTYVPMSGLVASVQTSLDGVNVAADTGKVLPDYFSTMKIAVLTGRAFNGADTASSMPVAIVNDAMARALRADGRVLGTRIQLSPRGRPPVERVVVGVIANTRSLGSNTRPFRELYVPFAQDPAPMLNLFVETDGRADTAVTTALRAAIHDVSADIVLEPVVPYADILGRTVSRQRLGAWLLGIFATMAVGLAAVGLMTTIGWWVSQRSREIGVRVALGATRAQVRRLVLRQGLMLGAAGIGIGLATAAGTTRFMASWLYGVTPLDRMTFAGAAALMFVVAVVAISWPVRRALRVDPAVTLRAD